MGKGLRKREIIKQMTVRMKALPFLRIPSGI